MILNCRVSAVLSMFFVFVACEDSLDEVYQDTDEIVRSKLIKKIKVVSGEGEIENYSFNYDDKNILKSFSTSDSEIINLEYNDNGELTNSKEVIENIFYIDDILEIPYTYEEMEMYIVQKNELGDPTLVKMYLTDKGETKAVSVEISYDPTPNIYRPYLLAGGVLDAADKQQPTSGRTRYFTSKFVPKQNLSSIKFINQESREEHIFIIQHKYNQMELVTMTDITHFDFSDKTSNPKTKNYTLLYSYVGNQG